MPEAKKNEEFDLGQVAIGDENQAQEGASFGDEEGLVVDLEGVNEQGEFPILPRGIYDVTLYELTYGHSQNKGNPMWTWVWEVENAPDPNHNGRRIWYHTTFTDQGRTRVKRCLARVKCDDDYNKTLMSGPFKPEDVALEGRLLGAKARARVDIRPYQGKKTNNVRDILPPNTSTDASFLNA